MGRYPRMLGRWQRPTTEHYHQTQKQRRIEPEFFRGAGTVMALDFVYNLSPSRLHPIIQIPVNLEQGRIQSSKSLSTPKQHNEHHQATDEAALNSIPYVICKSPVLWEGIIDVLIFSLRVVSKISVQTRPTRSDPMSADPHAG